MPIKFCEIRISELQETIAFAHGLGSTAEQSQVQHQLSLAAREDGQTQAVALCLKDKFGRFSVELSIGEPPVHADLLRQLTDGVLRKVQSAGIGITRVRSLIQGQETLLWSQTNWLNNIDPVDPMDPVLAAADGSAAPEQAQQPSQAA